MSQPERVQGCEITYSKRVDTVIGTKHKLPHTSAFRINVCMMMVCIIYVCIIYVCMMIV